MGLPVHQENFPAASTQKTQRTTKQPRRKDHKRKTSSISCCSATQNRSFRKGRLGETRSSPLTCPSRTLSQEELFKNITQKPGRNNKNHKRKTDSISCCLSAQKQERQKARVHNNNLPTQNLSAQNPKSRRTFRKASNKTTRHPPRTQKRKTGSISCCFSTQKPKTKTENRPKQFYCPNPSYERTRCKTLRARTTRPRPKWKPNLRCDVANKNNQTPRIDSSSGETARVDSGGCGAPLETKQDNDNHNA